MTDPKLTPREPSEAERLAQRLDNCAPVDFDRDFAQAAAELLRLQAENDALRAERDLGRQDWDRVHHALAKHGEHPGRTDDRLADVIDRALTRLKAAAPQPAALPELSDAEIGRLVDRMDNTHDSDLLKFARAVIAAMKGKQ